MYILCFDTCLNKMFVSLGSETELLSSKIIENTNTHYHSAFLISTIKSILKENNLTPNDINRIGVNIGPGSFTGIRACTTVARIFAQAKNIDIVGVCSLEILSKISNKEKILVALDARKESVYVAGYEFGKCILEPQVMKIEEFEKLISTYDDVILDNYLAEKFERISYQSLNIDLGKYLYEITKIKAPETWSMLKPLYLQPPPVSCKK